MPRLLVTAYALNSKHPSVAVLRVLLPFHSESKRFQKKGSIQKKGSGDRVGDGDTAVIKMTLRTPLAR
jgi:hypothetical protein